MTVAKIPRKTKNKRLRRWVVCILGEATDAMSHDEILRVVNSTTKHGMTSPQLSNILSKDEAFERVGESITTDIMGTRYTTLTYVLSPTGEELFSAVQEGRYDMSKERIKERNDNAEGQV
jgi:hypothetical protein